MSLTCPTCKRSNPPRARFCPGCGQSLAGGMAAQLESASVATPASAHRPAAETASLPVTAGSEATVSLPPQSGLRVASIPASPPIKTAPMLQADTDHRLLPSVPMPPVSSPAVVLGGLTASRIAGSLGTGVTVRLGLDFNRVLIVGHGCTVQVRIENCAPLPLEEVEVRLRSRGFTQATPVRLRHLGPAIARTHLVEVEPGRAGNFVLTCEVLFRQGGRLFSYQGETSVNVNAVPETGNISLQLGDIQVNQGTNAGLGMDKLEISNLLGNNVRTLNDLLNVHLPEHFRDVELTEAYDVDEYALCTVRDAQSGWLVIPSGFAREASPSRRICLRPESAGGPEILLTAAPEFRIGRDATSVDCVTWFLPRSPANDDRTRRLSKLHVIGRMESGRPLFWRGGPLATALLNGVTLGEKNVAVPLDHRAVLSLSGDYELEVTPFPSGVAGGLRVMGEEGASPVTGTGGAVRFTPLNGGAAARQAVWVFTDAAFGLSTINAMPLAIPSLGDIQGRFHFRRGGFWLENFLGNGAVRVQGGSLAAAQIVPLQGGMKVELGGVRFTVECR